MKTMIFVCEQFLTSKRSKCHFEKGLDTSFDTTFGGLPVFSFPLSAWLLGFERFHEHGEYISDSLRKIQ